jgi:hypothetical protein
LIQEEEFPKAIKSVYKTGIGLSTIVGFPHQYKFSDLV